MSLQQGDAVSPPPLSGNVQGGLVILWRERVKEEERVRLPCPSDEYSLPSPGKERQLWSDHRYMPP
jgi:hypothetical protein